MFGRMSNELLKALARVSKILAIFITAVVGLLILPPRWGFSPIADVQIVGLAVLSLLPNRWLVSSRISFVLFLLIALFPFHVYFSVSAFRRVDFGLAALGIIFSLGLFGPLPLSLILSHIRFRRGETFLYA
jgi:hypothetical protein